MGASLHSALLPGAREGERVVEDYKKDIVGPMFQK